MVNEQAYYKDGYDKSVSSTHEWRKVENSVAFLIPYLKPNVRILDVGSGPGTITLDMGNYAPHASIIGIEPTEELIDVANANKAKLVNSTGEKLDNITFQLGSAYQIPFPDNTFDVVHAHQVVVHLEDPVAALKEFARVTKPGGHVCVKDGDIKGFVIYPDESQEQVSEFLVYRTQNSTTDGKAGRSLKAKALRAGYDTEHLSVNASTWCISTDKDRAAWADMYINRVNNSTEYKDLPQHKKDQFTLAWKAWADNKEGWLAALHGEIIYEVPE